MYSSPLKLGVLISGSGTTMQNLLDHIAAKKLAARIELVIASRPGIKGIERATDAGLKCFIVERRQFPAVANFSRKIFSYCDEFKVDLVCLGGWLQLLDIPPAYAGRVMNIHPALLPSFGGKGMYGAKVHQAVIDHGCKISGCTVHFVDANYDSGPIISQRACPVLDDDTADSLAHRVFEEEKIAYPHAIEMFRKGKLRIDGRRVSS